MDSEVKVIAQKYNLEESKESPPCSPDSSKAIASAMRALQTKIKLLEEEKLDLKRQLEEVESKSYSDRERWQSKLLDSMPSEETKLKEQVEFLKAQCQFAEAETKRIKEQYEIDKESWMLEVEHWKRSSQKPQTDYKAQFEALKKELNSERETWKNKVHKIEQELIAAKNQYESTIQELQSQNKTYKDTCEELRSKLALIKQRSSTPRSLSSSRNKPSTPRNKAKPKKTRKRSTSSKKLSKTSSRKNSLKSSVVTIPRPTPKQSPENQILKLEKEISKLNSRYKELLFRSQNNPEDLSSLRTELTQIASSLEEKSSKLYELKKHQQNALRERMLNS